MKLRTPCAVALGCLAGMLISADTAAQIVVEGVQDRQVVADRATLRVVPAVGFTDTARIDDAPVAVGQFVDVLKPDYHELVVERRSDSTGAIETRLVRFIVRDSTRGNSEWGLPPWTPFPSVPSAAGEFEGAQIELMLPAAFPTGLEIPAVAWLKNATGAVVGANGLMKANGFSDLELKRGVGSTRLAAASTAGLLNYSPVIHSASAARSIAVEENTVWSAVSGVLSNQVAWPANSRIHVTSNLVLATGATLTIGADTVLKLAGRVEIQGTNAALIVDGTTERPVVFTPETRSAPWGGIVFRGSAAEIRMTGAILTGSGADPNWFGNNPGNGSSHRSEQPLIYISEGARATLTDSALIDNFGQAAHGENSFFSAERCLIQKCITTGQFNGGRVDIRDSALIEFPADDTRFEDDDNDGLYLTAGTHSVSNTLIGWAKDDGIDAGSGGAGSVTVTGCWVESCFHEALAWSGTGRIVRVSDTVVLNSGQGIECGWDNPDVFADRCVSIGNVTGARFGDNYDWTYAGFLRVTNSFLLFNYRNIWGRTWDDWTERLAQMDLQGNFISRTDALHPTNVVWQSNADGWRLAPFLTTPSGAEVGIGFATRARQFDVSELSKTIPVGLSTFTTNDVAVEYMAESSGELLAQGRLQFEAGEMVKHLQLALPRMEFTSAVRVRLSAPSKAALTGSAELFFVPGADPLATLIPKGAEWRFLDGGIEAPADWRDIEFTDASWRKGEAELGFGDDDEQTPIDGGPSTNRFPTVYFRRAFVVPDAAAFAELTLNLRRDDGAVVYLNGAEIFRSNMPTGEVRYATLALSDSTSETTFFTEAVDASGLRTGTNVIAVEVHQATRASSDLSFDLELVGRRTPRLLWETRANELVLYWSDSAMSVEQAQEIGGPWERLEEARSPLEVAPAANRFYRLIRVP